MKKYLLLLCLAIVLIGGTVASGTFALFGDTETSGENVFTAGTIDLSVNDENPWQSQIDTHLNDMAPGDSEEIYIKLTAVGSNPTDIWMRITGVETDGGPATYYGYASSEPEYVAEGGTFTAGVPDGNNTPINDIDSVVSLAVDLGNKDTGYGTLYVNAIKDKWIYLGNLEYLGYWIGSIGFKINAGAVGEYDEYQGDTMTFDIEFFAQQSEGDTQPDPPGTELGGYERP